MGYILQTGEKRTWRGASFSARVETQDCHDSFGCHGEGLLARYRKCENSSQLHKNSLCDLEQVLSILCCLFLLGARQGVNQRVGGSRLEPAFCVPGAETQEPSPRQVRSGRSPTESQGGIQREARSSPPRAHPGHWSAFAQRDGKAEGGHRVQDSPFEPGRQLPPCFLPTHTRGLQGSPFHCPGGTLATQLVTSPAHSAISLLEVFHNVPSLAQVEARGTGVHEASAEQTPGGAGGTAERSGRGVPHTAAASHTLLPETERLSLHGNENRLENSLRQIKTRHQAWAAGYLLRITVLLRSAENTSARGLWPAL